MQDNHRRLAAVVLAAGRGKRMKSDLPKVLLEVAGRPIVLHVLDTLEELEVERTILVVGHQAEKVVRAVKRPGIVFVEQKELLGTGHAVMMVEEDLRGFDGDILVLLGDAPLLRASTIKKLLAEHHKRDAVGTVLTAILPDPTGYGRIVRNDDGQIVKIVEHKDATEEEREIAEMNSGTFVFKKAPLFEALGRIDNINKQGEYYLTDVMQVFLEGGMPTAGYRAEDYCEALGVNSAEELAAIDALMRAKLS
jgi:UDP-N-acetylglucosamine diphosphorylase/glucosamine-1-phosphate N-acetyltransferase